MPSCLTKKQGVAAPGALCKPLSSLNRKTRGGEISAYRDQMVQGLVQEDWKNKGLQSGKIKTKTSYESGPCGGVS